MCGTVPADLFALVELVLDLLPVALVLVLLAPAPVPLVVWPGWRRCCGSGFRRFQRDSRWCFRWWGAHRWPDEPQVRQHELELRVWQPGLL